MSDGCDYAAGHSRPAAKGAAFLSLYSPLHYILQTLQEVLFTVLTEHYRLYFELTQKTCLPAEPH